MGIPTIKRERDSYLLQTLESLLSNLDEMEQEDCLIVVFVGEVIIYLVSGAMDSENSSTWYIPGSKLKL